MQNQKFEDDPADAQQTDERAEQQRKDAGPSHRDQQRGDPLSDEVASEGGSPGDVELRRGTGPGRGSEATQLWESEQTDIDEIHRDDTGRGRRSPVEP